MDISFLNDFVSAEVLVYIKIFLAAIGAGALAAAHLPRKNPDKWYWKLLDFIAQNVNKAKNKN